MLSILSVRQNKVIATFIFRASMVFAVEFAGLKWSALWNTAKSTPRGENRAGAILVSPEGVSSSLSLLSKLL